MLQFFDMKTQKRHILLDEVNVSKRKLASLIDSLENFLIKFNKASKFTQIQLPNLKLKSQKQNQKTISLLINIETSMTIQIDHFFYLSNSETTAFASFLSRSFNNTVISSYLQKMWAITVAKFTTSGRTGWKQVWRTWKQWRCVVQSPLLVGMTIPKLNLLGAWIVWIQCVLIDFASTKRLSSLLKKVTINVFIACQRVKCSIIPLETNHFVFLDLWPRVLYFWRDEKNNARRYWRWVLPSKTKQRVYRSTNRSSSFSDCKIAKPALTCFLFHSRTKNHYFLVWCWWYILLCKKTSRDYEKKIHF